MVCMFCSSFSLDVEKAPGRKDRGFFGISGTTLRLRRFRARGLCALCVRPALSVCGMWLACIPARVQRKSPASRRWETGDFAPRPSCPVRIRVRQLGCGLGRAGMQDAFQQFVCQVGLLLHAPPLLKDSVSSRAHGSRPPRHRFCAAPRDWLSRNRLLLW